MLHPAHIQSSRRISEKFVVVFCSISAAKIYSCSITEQHQVWKKSHSEVNYKKCTFDFFYLHNLSTQFKSLIGRLTIRLSNFNTVHGDGTILCNNEPFLFVECSEHDYAGLLVITSPLPPIPAHSNPNSAIWLSYCIPQSLTMLSNI